MKKILVIFSAICFFYSCSLNDTSEDHLYRINVNNKYGFIDSAGNVVVAPKYIYAQDFSEGLAFVVYDTLAEYKLRPTLKSLLNPDKKQEFEKRLERYFVYGYIDKSGEFKINGMICREYKSLFHYTLDNVVPEAFSFSEGYAIFKDTSNFKIGYINSKGDKIIKSEYYDGLSFSAGLALVSIQNDSSIFAPQKWGFINKEGSMVIPAKYDEATDFSCNVANVKYKKDQETEYYGQTMNVTLEQNMLIDKDGNLVHELEALVEYSPFQEGYSICRHPLIKGCKFVDIDLNNKTNVIEDAKSFTEYKAAVKLDNKWGFIDTSFKQLIIPLAYDDVKPFHEGKAAVKSNRHWGYIDGVGDTIIPFKFDSCSSFKNGLASFLIKGNINEISGYINSNGKVVWQTEKEN